MIEIITGSIIDSKEKYIAHQCNCVTKNSTGTAKAIFDAFPFANSYENREEPDTVGTIKIFGNGVDNRYVINMFAQHYPGRPKFPTSKLDGTKAREEYFHKCLIKISKIPDLESIAFPWKIGCNLGGGDWEYYFGTLKNFERFVNEKFETKVVIYRRTED
jgi:O-acetyl-ADP-ribose deacetylase (regulator of RNase III)